MGLSIYGFVCCNTAAGDVVAQRLNADGSIAAERVLLDVAAELNGNIAKELELRMATLESQVSDKEVFTHCSIHL